MAVLGPAVAWLLAFRAETVGSGAVWDGSLAPWLGPLVGLYALTSGGVEPIETAEWRSIVTILTAAALLWIVAPPLMAFHRRWSATAESGRPMA